MVIDITKWKDVFREVIYGDSYPLIQRNLELMLLNEKGGMLYFSDYFSVGRSAGTCEIRGIIYPCRFARLHFYDNGKIQSFSHDVVARSSDGCGELFSGDIRLASARSISVCRNELCRTDYAQIVDLYLPGDTPPTAKRVLRKSVELCNLLMWEIRAYQKSLERTAVETP